MSRRIRSARSPAASQRLAGRSAFTLVEMLIAMAITLVMMAAVASLFANVSTGVRNRRATIEMTGQLRHLRNVLQQDLQGATCPGITWQRPESNHGYIEIIEGRYRDSFPSMLTDGNPDSDGDGNPGGNPDELDPRLSIVPRNNGADDTNRNGRIDASEWEDHYNNLDGRSFTKGSGLGDYDDILMLTVRNENEPFVGRMPTNVRDQARAIPFDASDGTLQWGYQTIESTLAEVVWFAIENPDEDNNANRFFGEPGMRTIYRRTLLIAPWINPYRFTDQNGNVTDTFQSDGQIFKSEPGLVRLLPDNVEFADVAVALAAVVAFQDRYDLSVRLEWDPNIGDDGRWKIMANTLGDLTKRENRFGHFGFHIPSGSGTTPQRLFPYPMASTGRGYASNNGRVLFVSDPEISGPADDASAMANMIDAGALGRVVESYTIDPAQNLNNPNSRYQARPFAYVDEESGMSATARAMLNDNGEVVRVVHGPVPLWGTRRGEDVMMTDALAFDLRVYDAGAPLFRHKLSDTMLEPGDRGWFVAYLHADNMRADEMGAIGTASNIFPYAGQGAYVDLGFGFYPFPSNLSPISPPISPHLMAFPVYAPAFSTAAAPWFFANRGLTDVLGNLLAPGYSVYDTWSFHYENNGRNDDGDEMENGVWQIDDSDGSGIPLIDEGTNGLDDVGHYSDGNAIRLGPDDVGERETAPPYDKPLRGAQVLVRVYERDSRAIRQVRVSQHFMPE